ncbi:hypothetical protein ACLK19_18025 [Escherichia coli]
MTNSLHIVNALSELDNEQTILMPGGTFVKNRPHFTDSWQECLEHFSFDKLFMGTTASISMRAYHLRRGLYRQ